MLASRTNRSHPGSSVIQRIDLGRLLKEQDRYQEAIECLREAIALNPRNAQGHFLLAATLAPAALTEEAAESYRRAIELQPRHAAAWLGLGHGLKTLGRTEEGIAAYRRCPELKPGNGEIWWSLANLKTYRFEAADIERMRAFAEAADTDESSRVNFLFALGNAADDAKDYAGAWRCYVEATRRQRALLSYDPVQTETVNSAIIDQPWILPAALINALRREWVDHLEGCVVKTTGALRGRKRWSRRCNTRKPN